MILGSLWKRPASGNASDPVRHLDQIKCCTSGFVTTRLRLQDKSKAAMTHVHVYCVDCGLMCGGVRMDSRNKKCV